jgi:hypothetical protein
MRAVIRLIGNLSPVQEKPRLFTPMTFRTESSVERLEILSSNILILPRNVRSSWSTFSLLARAAFSA